jgi:hypothetical protein
VRSVQHWNFDLVVFDEASRLRKGGRQGSVGWKMMNAIRKKKAPRILLMSGSPRPGTAHELYAPVYLLDGGARLGHTLTGFRERFLAPNKVDRHTGRVFSWKLREGAEHELYPLIADLFYAATPDLGLRFVEVDRQVALPEDVMLQINRMQREMVADFIDEEITAGSLGVVSGKLQQMGNGEVFNDHGGTTVTHDRKIADLQELVEELATATAEPVPRSQVGNAEPTPAAEQPGLEEVPLPTAQQQPQLDATTPGASRSAPELSGSASSSQSSQ